MRRKPIALALLSATVMSAGLSAATGPQPDDPLVVITAHYGSRVQLQRIASHFQHLMIDDKTRTIRVEATHDEMVALRRQGIDARIDDDATRRLRASEAQMQGVETQTISGYPCYRTVDETYATMDQLVQARPALARIIDIGPTWQESRQAGTGHRMRVLRLTNAATDSLYPNKPSMVIFASIHAREYTPAELLTRFAESLVNGYGTDAEATWLLDNFRFHLVLQANPDGREKAETGLSWRKNVDDSNGACSATTYGIDLNRNFPYLWNTVADGSSSDACASTYRGPQPLSEPEAQNLLRYVAGTPNASGVYPGGALPNQTLAVAPSVRKIGAPATSLPRPITGMFIDLHSYNQVVLWPWAYSTTPARDAAALGALGRRMAWFNGYKPEQWADMYAADGTTGDTLYARLGTPSYTIELGASFFESCSTFEGDTLGKNLATLRYAARNLAAPYVFPSGPDTATIGVAPATVSRGTPVVVTARVDDSRFNQSNGTEAVQAIVGARAYVDTQPWSPAPRGTYAMHASDGAFNATGETVTVSIPTAGLAQGRHVVAVRGTDASNHAGTPAAVYFTVQ
ncbi:MAG: lieA [Xanthomonadaceae bacterium]|nr:lieA [Xanthomonadaceae bacterium]